MWDFLNQILSSGPFIPHGHCYLWKPGLVWLHLASDALIALAYYSIPLTLFYFVQKRDDLPFNWIFLLFASFIVACGTTHLMEVWTLWHPTYWLSGLLKAGTASVSLFTALQLVPLVPKALELPSPAQLAQANQALQTEITERRRIEGELRQYQNQLEERVAERTAELMRANEQLQQEIAERQRTEESLRQSEAKFRQLAENINEVFWLVSPDGKQVFYISPAYEQIWGRSCDSLYQHPESWMSSIYSPDRAQVEVTLNRRFNGDECLSQEYRIVQPNGTLRWIGAREYPVRNEDGEIYRIVGIGEDITDRKQAEAEREQLLQREQSARSEAEAANRTKDEFLSILSHELRTPLNAILGWAQLLRSKRQIDAATRERALETIERNARGQANLIEDLLDISRIIAGKLRLDVRPTNLVSVIEAAIDTVRPAAEAKAIRIQAVLDPAAGLVSGDADRLQQVVWNLLSNAVKFTPKGGRVQVRLERVNSHVEIIVSDTGQGIPLDLLPAVFDRFRQGNSSTTRLHGGLGLGLAIVRHLVELHGGSVHAESAGEGQGATFIVNLPLAVLKPSSGSERVHPTAGGDVPFENPPNLSGLQILLVDDEADARDLLSTVLSGCGATVTTAASAAAALDCLQRLQPDVLISDIGMPDEDGYALIARVRALPPNEGGRTPAIALTAYARVEDRTRTLAAGFQMHMAKPVNLIELTTVIASLTGRTHEQLS
ncbi:MAG: PAS domain-containing protein [Synechococcales cyanobacterium C42_A2020_086]|jgi:PAS domain S-box-containing protein|nr:PAS domain-containing protein [Synechococcales cyanobacterium C42_A2020_086]